jgi:LysR family transcriptional regulator, glycine cleavage system transcriptional activator
MPRLPPLTALRVLESIGETGSITAAAKMLNVSHSAVSFQIKVLELRANLRPPRPCDDAD